MLSPLMVWASTPSTPTQIENEKPLTAENFVTREQFDSLNGKLDMLIKELGVSKNG